MKQNLGTIFLLSLQMHLLEWMLETKQSDRDYTYQEVTSKLVVLSLHNSLFFGGLLVAANTVLSVFAYRKILLSFQMYLENDTPLLHLNFSEKGNKKFIFANVTDICKTMHRQVSNQ